MFSPLDFLKKIQRKSLSERKVIFWLFISVLGAACLGFWLFLAKQRFNQIDTGRLRQEFNIPGFEKQFQELESLNTGAEKLEQSVKDLEEMINSGDLPTKQ